MNGLQVGQHLFMCEGAQYQDVDLRGARIDGQVAMTGATIEETLNMNGLQAGDGLFLRGGADFKKPAQLTYAIVEKNVHLHGSTFHSVDLHGTQVKGDLILGPPAVTWKPEVEPDVVRLDLNAAKVGVLRDSEDSWPEKVELDGFVYDRWGGYSGEDPGGFHTRPVKWFKDWLKKEQPFRPQPYEQLAKVLKESGHPEKAKETLYAAKEEDRKGAEGLIRKSWLLLMKLTVGYGYKHHLLIFWTLLFIAAGYGVLEATGQCADYRWFEKIWFSLDTLIPFVKLNMKHYNVSLCNIIALNYFYFHQLVGYILVTALIAGVTGLLKK